jgi:hypothetical protein
MSTNFHYEWTDGSTLYKPTSLNPAWGAIDQGVTFIKNVIVSCDGTYTYSTVSGVFSWSDTIRIIFNNDDGDVVQNTIATSSVTLNDNDIIYVDLNGTNGTVLTVSKTAMTFMDGSDLIDYNRLILGYKNSSSDVMFNYFFDLNPDNSFQGS